MRLYKSCLFGLVAAALFTVPSSSLPTTRATHVTLCPTVKEYSRSFLKRAASEQAQLRQDSAVKKLLKDYLIMRDQARICWQKRLQLQRK